MLQIKGYNYKNGIITQWIVKITGNVCRKSLAAFLFLSIDGITEQLHRRRIGILVYENEVNIDQLVHNNNTVWLNCKNVTERHF